MRCVKCGNAIDENEVLCNNCKKELKSESSRNELKEYETAIEENRILNEDENTKELTDLDRIIEEKIETEKVEEKEELPTEEKIEELRVDKYNKKTNKKKIIIIVSICLIVIISIVMLVLFFNKDKSEDEVTKLDYEKILTRYGKKIENKLYDLEEIPEWDELVKDIEYKYNIECEEHEIYSDKKIYLNNCKVDDKKVKYSYGEKQKEKKQAELSIYRSNDKYNGTDGELIATITCESEECDYINAFDNYVIVKEDNLYNLYNYANNKKTFGPFNDVTNLIYINNTLYGIYYTDGNRKNIYSLVSDKLLENVDGKLVTEAENFNPTLMYMYGYAMLSNKGYKFLNLKTGKVDYAIADNILRFEEDARSNVVYILTYKKDINNFKVINSHGKELFNKEINYFKLTDGGIVIGDSTSFTVYDSKLNVITDSKKYDSVISIYDDYVIVVDSSIIKLLDLSDNTLAQFDLEIKNEIDKEKSGWNTIDGKTGIFIIFKGTDTKLFYDSNTGEMELIDKN